MDGKRGWWWFPILLPIAAWAKLRELIKPTPKAPNASRWDDES